MHEDEQRKSFMASNGMDFDIVSNADKMKRADKLVNLSGVNNVNIVGTTFYRYYLTILIFSQCVLSFFLFSFRKYCVSEFLSNKPYN